MIIFPAIDILGGKCVRLAQGDYARKTAYSGDPIAVALSFQAMGAGFLHVVDLDGAKAGEPMNFELIARLCRSLSIPVQVGGGIRDTATIARYLNAGAARVILGSRALDMDFLKTVLQLFGPDRLVVSLDARDGKLATEGWKKTSNMNLFDFAGALRDWGVRTVIATDIARDGMLGTPNFEWMRRLCDLGLNVIASGGVSDASSLQALKSLGATGAIVGKALYEKKLVLSGLTKRVIPCMDIAGGRVVKGIGFKNLQDVGSAVELAKIYSDTGADELVFLDITATVDKRKTLVTLVRQVAAAISIPFCVGGGIRTLEDIRVLLAAGADKVALGTVAVHDPDFVRAAAAEFGSQCIVISIDAKRVGNFWAVYTRGGRDQAPVDAVAFAREMEARGAGELLVNSLDTDGTRQGYDIPLLQAVSNAVGIPVIASSGAGSREDFLKAFTVGRCSAALGASLFHYGELGIPELKRFLLQNNIPLRPCL